jgi:beta-lactamase superfamily II metal-dependent hydrolase
MFKLHVLQAAHGDCLLLEFGSTAAPDYALIDGGPSGTYADHLKPELTRVKATGGTLALAVLSHVDDDHVNGLLDLLDDLVAQRRADEPETIAIEGIWHNSFGQTLGPAVERTLAQQQVESTLPRGAMPATEMQARSIRQGHELTALARGLSIPINAGFRDTPDRLVCVDNVDGPIQLDNLSLLIVGPTRSTLLSLQEEWEEWLDAQRQAKSAGGDAVAIARSLDRSVPNLSSMMLLVEAENRRVLLTGDGRGDHLLTGLAEAGALDEAGKLHVDIFKLPHHGSARNVNAALFDRITADTYVICADGKHDNPDLQTLEWLVQSTSQQGRSIRIVATNETPSTRDLVDRYDPAQYGYSMTFLKPGSHSITLDLVG